jgi:hypothetical protein
MTIDEANLAEKISLGKRDVDMVDEGIFQVYPKLTTGRGEERKE